MMEAATLTGRRNGKAPMPVLPSRSEMRVRSEVDLIVMRFRLLAKRRAAWLHKLWSEEGEPGGRTAVTHAEIATIIADRDSPQAESAWTLTDFAALEIAEELANVEADLQLLSDSRFAQLANVFQLSREDCDLLQACLAVALDPTLARVCAYLQDNASRPFVTEDFAARLFGYGRAGVWRMDSSLFRFGIIESRDSSPGEPRALICDPLIRDWILGLSGLDAALIGHAHFHFPLQPLPSWPLQELSDWAAHALNSRQNPVRIRIDGPRGAGRRTFAACISSSLGLPLLVIDCDGIDDQRWLDFFMRAQRQAFLDGCAIAWSGESLARRAWPRGIPLFPLQFVIAEAGQEVPPALDMLEKSITLPLPSAAERETLWREHIPESASWDQEEFRALVRQHRLLPGDIAVAARLGTTSLDQCQQMAIESSRSKLGNLAQRMECPFTWDDLIVSDSLREILHDFEFEAKNRLDFWEQSEARRIFPQGRGLLALLSGPPGTGKTMAAQVIARNLGYDLYRVNLATVVSKWVGETSQNLERILTRAAAMDAVLLFDEADALFSKRATEVRDVQDRFANTDTAYLLQAIENYPGIALLTSNQKGSIDPAFRRRLRFVIEFAKPNAAEQETLWKRTITSLAGEDVLARIAPSLPALAQNIESTGAQIKNAVLGAIFMAQRQSSNQSSSANSPTSVGGGGWGVDTTHIIKSLERELSKEGRAIGVRERERIAGHAK